MTQLTIRFDDELASRLRRYADQEGISLNKAVVRWLRNAAGLGAPKSHDEVGASLDHLIGTWSDEETTELGEAVKVFETIDDELWQ